MSLLLLTIFTLGPTAQAYDPFNPLDPLNLPPACEFSNGRYPCTRGGKVIRSRFEDPMFKRFFNEDPPSLFDCPDGYSWGLIIGPMKKFGEPREMRYGCRDALGRPLAEREEVRVPDPPHRHEDPPAQSPRPVDRPQTSTPTITIEPAREQQSASSDDVSTGGVPVWITVPIGALMLLVTGYMLGARSRHAS